MSNEGRNAYVIEHLTDALLTLLRDHSINDVSISQLCECAGVGRASFYRNFENKEDIVRLYINRLFCEWADAYEQGDDKPLSALIQSIFAHRKTQRFLWAVKRKKAYISAKRCYYRDMRPQA